MAGIPWLIDLIHFRANGDVLVNGILNLSINTKPIDEKSVNTRISAPPCVLQAEGECRTTLGLPDKARGRSHSYSSVPLDQPPNGEETTPSSSTISPCTASSSKRSLTVQRSISLHEFSEE